MSGINRLYPQPVQKSSGNGAHENIVREPIPLNTMSSLRLIPPAVDEVIIHQPNRLAVSIHNGGSHKRHAALL
jgi:hypothetical protein